MDHRKAKVTEEHRAEARRLNEIWERNKPCGQAEFGERYEIGNQGAVSQFLNGKVPLSLKAAIGFASGLGVNIGDFSERLAKEAARAAHVGPADHLPPVVMEPASQRQASRAGHVRIPVLEVSPSAGHGGEPVDFPAIRDYLEVAEAWAQRRFGMNLGALRIVSVGGDSMAPTLNDGDLVFVDTSVTSFEREGIYVLMFDGRLLIKRIRANLSSRLVEICSDNERAYPVQTVHSSELDRLHIIGAVRAWWSLQSH